MNDFYAVLDLDKLADKLTPLMAKRLGVGVSSDEPPWNDAKPERGRADRAAPDDWPSEPDTADDSDPWASDEPREERRSQTRSAPRSSGASRSGSNRSGGGSSRGGQRGGSRSGGSPDDFPDSGTHTDGVGKEWTFGLDDAPECDCRLVAAEVTKPRAKWRAWACPVGFTKNYKNKCDYWEYQD